MHQQKIKIDLKSPKKNRQSAELWFTSKTFTHTRLGLCACSMQPFGSAAGKRAACPSSLKCAANGASRKSEALTICMEKPIIPERFQMKRFIPV